jgi:hypothetical protein
VCSYNPSLANVNILRALQGIWQNVTEMKGMNFVELLGRNAIPMDTFIEENKQHYNELFSYARREYVTPFFPNIFLELTTF